jgi:tetratricopeptide (TPR) repeat protein
MDLSAPDPAPSVPAELGLAPLSLDVGFGGPEASLSLDAPSTGRPTAPELPGSLGSLDPVGEPVGLAPLALDTPPEGGQGFAPLALSLDADAPLALSPAPSLDVEGGGLSLDPSLPALELDQPTRDAPVPAGGSTTPAGSMTLDDLVGPSALDAGTELAKPKLRTMTAARLPAVRLEDPELVSPKRRKAPWVVGLVGAVALVAAGFALDLPSRLRGAPATATVLAPLAARLAADDLTAYVEAADALEAAADRHHSPALAADAAGLLAAAAALHGSASGVARAESLLAPLAADDSAPSEARRARAWLALSRGRSAEAARLAASLDPQEAPMLRGWVALLKDDASAAVQELTNALAQPAPWPSRLVAELGQARAQEESGHVAAAAAAYARMLTEAPHHPPAVLGRLRTAKLDPATRIKEAETLRAPSGPRSSPAEVAQAAILIMRAATELHQPERAALALKQAIAADPSSLAVAVAQGDALLAEGKLTEASAKYRTALTPTLSASRTPPERFAAAAALLEQGKIMEARALLDRVAPNAPEDPRVPYWRGRADELGAPPDPTAAEQHYNEALTRDARFVPATLQLARLLIERRRGGEALAVCRKAEQAGAPALALKVSLGRAQLASGNLEGARQTFEGALARDADLAGARLGLAAALEAGGRLGEAKAQLETLLKKAPDTPGLRASLAEILVKTGRLEDALVVYQEEVQRGPANPATQLAAIRLGLQLGKRDVARTLAEKLVENDPRTPGALLLLAEVRKADGDLNRALSELRRALAYENTPEVHFEYAKVLAVTGREDDAIEELLQAGSIPEARLERGRLLLRRGQLGPAADELEVVVKMQPQSAPGWLLLGNVRDRLGQTAAAETAWKTALRLAPDNAEAHYRYGRLLVDRGQISAALPQLHAAEGKESPGSPWAADLYFQIGFAERTGGSRHAAALAYRKYLAMASPDAPSRVEAERQLQELGH